MSYYKQLLASDWLGRDQEEYTYEKSGLAIGWEKTLLKDEPISRYIIKVNSKNITMSKKLLLTKQACNTILSRMNVKKKKVNIVFAKNFQNYQSGETLCVTLEPLSKNIIFPTFNHALDPIIGYCVHEIAHLLYTDSAYQTYIKKFKGKEQEIKASIMNILEDERIESIIATTFRGYTGYLGKAKDYCFGKKMADEKKMNSVDDAEPINQFFETFLYLLRYPKALKEEYVDKFEAEVKEIQAILEPYPTDIPELIVATEKIYELFKKFFDQSLQQQVSDAGDDQTENSDEDSDAEKSDSSAGGNKGKKSKSGGSSAGSGNIDDEDGEDSDDGDSDDSSDSGEADAGNGTKPNDSKKTLEEALEDALKAMVKAVASSELIKAETKEDAKSLIGGGYSVDQALRDISSYDNTDLSKQTSFGHVYPTTANLKTDELSVIFRDAKDMNAKTNHYDKSLEEVRVYASSLRAKIQQLNRNQTLVNRGLFEGEFDDGLLVDALIGAKNVYKEEYKMLNQGATIALLVDESGSMGGRNWQEAQKIAVMFERALEGCNNVDFFCYGHTTGTIGDQSNATWINVYYEGRKKSNRKELGKIYAHATNRDGHAILETVGRIRSKIHKDMPIVMFMISDGEPSATVPSGYNGVSYTKKAVDTVEKYSNTTIIHIAIEKGIPSKEMFNHYLEFTDHSTMVRDIGNVLKKVMVKQQKTQLL